MEAAVQPDVSRCIVHVDVDCFYAQAEELRRPEYRGKPLAVQQKNIVVTCNYAARARGVGKLMLIKEALQRCPELVCVPGEDLTPYRALAKASLAVFSRYGAAEKLGLDEVWVDVTAQAKSLQREAAAPLPWAGHVHRATDAVCAPNAHRVMDLRAEHSPAGDAASEGEGASEADALLRAGSQLAARLRAALLAEVGLTASAGVAHNKLLSKLVSGLHKPDQQTSLPSTEARAFVAPLPVRALRGVGRATEQSLEALNIALCCHLARAPRDVLAREFGPRLAAELSEAAVGRDGSGVAPKGPPKAVSIEDSFAGVRSKAACEAVLRVLVPDLATRLIEDGAEQRGRRAQTLTLSWRSAGSGHARDKASCPMPLQLSEAALLRAALSLLCSSLHEPFCVNLLNLSAGRFTEGTSGAGRLVCAAPSGPGGLTPAHAAAAQQQRRSYASASSGMMSKAAERRLRECDAGPAGQEQTRWAWEGLECEEEEEDEDELFLGPDDAPTVPPAAAVHGDLTRFFLPPTEQAADGVACSECGRRIAVAEAGTHADWHFARSLQREERGGGVKGTPVQQKVARRGTPAKGPMDAFLRR